MRHFIPVLSVLALGCGGEPVSDWEALGCMASYSETPDNRCVTVITCGEERWVIKYGEGVLACEHGGKKSTVQFPQNAYMCRGSYPLYAYVIFRNADCFGTGFGDHPDAAPIPEAGE